MSKDYGLKGGRATLTVRYAMLFYVLKRLGLLGDATPQDPSLQHIVVLNKRETDEALLRNGFEPDRIGRQELHLRVPIYRTGAHSDALARQRPYLMSFGTGGLFVNESVVVARLHNPNEDWDATALTARQKGAFPVRKASSARRSIREIVNRLKSLSSDELAVLVEGERSEQAALLWLAACRAYRFIAEFAVEVLSERFLSLRTALTYDDFDAFLSAKEEWSPKLATLSVSTRAKLRAVLFPPDARGRDPVAGQPDTRGDVVAARVAVIQAGNADELRYFPGAERQVGRKG